MPPHRHKRSNPKRSRQRQEEALARQEVRKKLLPGQQLAKLDKKLGYNTGAEKERQKLWKLV